MLSFLTSRAGLALLAFLAIAGYFLGLVAGWGYFKK